MCHTWPPLELPPLALGGPNVSKGTADDHPRKLLRRALGTEAKGRPESSPKSKRGTPICKQQRLRGGLPLSPHPPRSGGLGTLGERKQLTQVSALWILSLGGWLNRQTKQKDAVPTALASQGWPGLYTEAAPGVPVTEPTAGMPQGGEERDV
ncbi:hypothetical protein HJG60_008920 [Phyllostomus discolor]|uniref:Uncharacterized protein n=1 Tax=Phyllostomus discolor TaxID=89673 RepID=A0A833YWS8_9CHIR|nr:hypothetical protein HJG60_008920 [Phyllostomus discolor]